MQPPESYLVLGLVVLLFLSISFVSAPLVSAVPTDEQLTEVTDYIHECQDNYGGQNFIWWDIKKYWVQNIIWFKLGDVFSFTIDPLVMDDFYYMAGDLRDMVRDYGAPPPYITEDEVYEIIQAAETGGPGEPEEEEPWTPHIPEGDLAIWAPIMMAVGLIIGLGIIGLNMAKRGNDPTTGLFMMVVGITFAWAVEWIPAWLFLTAIALIALVTAKMWTGVFGKGD